MTRKTLPLLALALAGLVLPAAGQDRPAPPRDLDARIARHVEQLDRRLDLTDAQAARLRAQLAEHARANPQTKRSATRPASPEARTARRDGLRTRHEATERIVRGVLTPEQQTRYDALRTERPARMQARGERGAARTAKARPGQAPRAARGGEIARALNLTEAQQAALRDRLPQQRAEVRAWMEAHPNATREEKRTYLQQHARTTDAAFEALLTPAQVERYRQLKTERRSRLDRPSREGRRR